MCDRNVKSEYILIKLCALVSEYICERTAKFHEKILFDSRVINIQIPVFLLTTWVSPVTRLWLLIWIYTVQHQTPRPVTYRNIKAVDPVKFAELIDAEKIYTSPAADVDAFADELDASVTRVMDMLAPARSRTMRVGKRSTKWLSTSAVDSRRRRLERRWRRTRAEVDRVAYRASCRVANLEINRSRQAFFQERLTTAGADQKARWKVVRELLHVDDQREDLAPQEARRLSTDFAKFFSNKLRRVADEVSARLAMTAGISRSLPPRSSLVYMDTLRCTDAAEVARLIRQAPPKQSIGLHALHHCWRQRQTWWRHC